MLFILGDVFCCSDEKLLLLCGFTGGGASDRVVLRGNFYIPVEFFSNCEVLHVATWKIPELVLYLVQGKKLYAG
jgi:hypothetical protein